MLEEEEYEAHALIDPGWFSSVSWRDFYFGAKSCRKHPQHGTRVWVHFSF
jgi:hypothetical protein